MTKLDTWTVTVEMTVFAGDMSKRDVMAEAENVLEAITSGTDFAGYCVVNAERDEI